MRREAKAFFRRIFPHSPTASNNNSEEQLTSTTLAPSPDSSSGFKEHLQVPSEHPRVPPSAVASVTHVLNSGGRLVLDLATESADVFPPLKSVLGGLTALLKYYDQTKGNKEKISRITPRVKTLASSMKVPKNGDTREIERRADLNEKLQKVLAVLQPIVDQGKASRFVFNAEDAQVISDAVEDIRDAITDYQTSLQQDIYDVSIETADLVLLDRLPYARDAGYSAGNRQKCLRDTRTAILRIMEDWAIADTLQRIYWLKGVAGIGKSTITQSFAEFAFAEGLLGASFFCSRDSVDRSDIKLLLPSLAYQLACRFPEFRNQLLPTIRADPNVGYASLSVQLQSLIVEPLRTSGISTVVVIDALDECRDDQSISTILSLLSAQVHHIPAVKFFIASRPESHLRSGFRLPVIKRLTEVLLLHEVEKTVVEHDIETFLRHHLSRIPAGRSDLELSSAPFPTEEDTLALAQKCGGLFIFASTALHFISSPDHDPRERLRTVVETMDTSTYGSQTGIDTLYGQILNQAYMNISVNDTEIFRRFRLVVGCILFLFNPMSCQNLAILLHMDSSQIKRTLRSLHSVLIVPDSPNEPIRIYHTSFFDYLTDATRCSHARFHIDPATLHCDISVHCLNLMNRNLRPNICDMPRYSMNDRVENLALLRNERIGDTLEYVCRFWTRHLSQAKTREGQIILLPLLKTFADDYLPCWVEVLSLVGHLPVSVPSSREVQRWFAETNVQDQGNLSTLFYECERLVLEFFDVIQSSAPHIHHSALPFSPSSSPLRKMYQAQQSTEVRVLTGIDSCWDECTRTIETDPNPSSVLSVAFSPTGSVIAAARLDGFVDILDATTGLRLDQFWRGQPGTAMPLVSYMDTPNVSDELVEFSCDGTLIATVSDYGMITVWFTSTGELLYEFGTKSSQSRSEQSFAFSPDGASIANAAGSQINIWDLQRRECIGVLQGDEQVFNSVRWSSTGTFIVSGADDGTVQLWDPTTKLCTKTLLYHMGSYVRAVALSADSNRMASCSDDGSIIIYDFQKGETIATFRSDDSILSVSFSPKGGQVAYASGNLVGVWDFTQDLSTQPMLFRGHSDAVNSVSFSPDGTSVVSGSQDCTVKLWQIVNKETRPSLDLDTHTRPSRILYTRFSPDGSRVASLSLFGTVQLWDSSTGVCTDHFRLVGLQGPVAISPNNKLLAIGADDNALWICPADRTDEGGTPVPILFKFANTGRIASVEFSPDSRKVIFATRYAVIGIWDVVTGVCVATLASPESWGFCSRAFFDSTATIVISEFKMDNTVRRWKLCDPSQNNPEYKLEPLSNEGRPNSDYLPSRIGPFYADGKWVFDQKGRAVCWLPKVCRLLDVWPGNVDDSSHWYGQKLVLGSGGGRVTILDFSRFPVDSTPEIKIILS